MALQERRPSGRERIEIKDLRNFVVIAEELNIARAAKRLGMQQSPLSRRLQALQAELGVKLIDTTGNRCVLTPHGRRTLAEARRVLQHLAYLYPHVRADLAKPRVRIGFTYSAGGGLPGLLDRSRDDAQGRLLSPTPTQELCPAAADFDVLLAPLRAAVPGIVALPLWQEPLLAVVPPGLALSALSKVLISELAAIGTLHYPSDLASALNAIPRRVVVAEVPYFDTASLEALIVSGQGAALVPQSLSRPFEQAGLILKPLADFEPVTICAYTVEANESGLGPWLRDLVKV